MNETILNIISIVITSVVLPLVSALGIKLINWINNKIQDEKTKKLLTSAVEIVDSAVRSVYQTFVENLKTKGEFKDEDKEEALRQAKDIVNNTITDSIKKVIEKNFTDYETWLTTAIESAIYLCKI